MIKLAANLTLQFTEPSLIDRIDAAADMGFTGVECLLPYETPASAVREAVERRNLTFTLFNFPVGNWSAGDRGIAADPARRDECRRSVDQGLEYARQIGCHKVHLMAGTIGPGAGREAWTETLIENIAFAADVAAPDSIEVLLEPINTKVDVPGYFYDSSAGVVAIMDSVDRSNVRMLFDMYHMQIMEGDLARTIEKLLPRIGHVQVADNPGRHEPGTGEINYPWLLSWLDALGYDGWVGCEYRPVGDTVCGLGWADAYLQK